jgi:hypothetical protein
MRLRSIWTAAFVCCVVLIAPNCTPAPGGRPPTVTVGVGVGIGHPRGYGPGWGYPPRYRPPRPVGPPHRPPRPTPHRR